MGHMTTIISSPEFLAFQAALAGEYSLQRELGRGGMGIVYLARDVQLDRDVAIKVLPTPLAQQPGSRARFLREARTAAGLSHPHIVPIHRVGELGGFVFFVMSYVAGQTLGERLRTDGPLPPADVTRVMREVAWALAYAHGRGIVHRDVKPDNILLEAGTGRALVTDFGIAHGGDGTSMPTDPGRIMGTAQFMSPEQAAAGALDGRSDIYSLGIVGYLAVSGRLPFASSNLPALLVRQATEAAPPVAQAAPGLPSALAVAIDRCLHRDVDARFANGEMLAAALVPPVEVRASLPAVLRAWLTARNPAGGIYGAWSALFAVGTIADGIALVTQPGTQETSQIVLTGLLALVPLIPVLSLHINRGRRLFRAGYTLADLRWALDVFDRERREADSPAGHVREGRTEQLLRAGTVASVVATGSASYALFHGFVDPTAAVWLALAPISMLVCAAASNAMDVSLLPGLGRFRPRFVLRDRLWRSTMGAWIATRLGAPERSHAVGAGIFRATEAALGVAAADLFAALPGSYRDQLAELPATVAALEARAAGARADVERLAAMAPGDAGGELFAQRRAAAGMALSSTVAALEGIRLDLLRLHAGAGDLAPLTTLMDAARLLGDDIGRLAEAQREVERIAPSWRLGARRVPTPV
jgi:hypothetical protein